MISKVKFWIFERNKEGEQNARRRSHCATSRTFCEHDAVAAKKTKLQPKIISVIAS